MKDYSKYNNWGKQTFILNYEIRDDQIIINYADGFKKQKLYTKDSEKAILEQMKAQVLFTNSKYFDNDFRRCLLWTLLCAWNIGVDTYNVITLENARVIFGLFGAWFIYYGGCNIKGMIDNKSTLTDLKKNMLFIENEDYFQETVIVDDKTSNAPITETRQIITLNDIDKMSYREVKHMVDFVKSNEDDNIRNYLRFDIKPMILKRKDTNK